MRHRLERLRDYLLGTLWFVPSLLVAASIGLGAGMVELSAMVDAEALTRWPRVFGASADSSRSILAAVAGSMITVAGLTFSLTMVAVTQASSQFTPRILRTFMNDRPNQIVLGTFVGVFAYCLVVLRTIRSVEERQFVPSLAVVLGIVLAMVSIGVLIYFVHHIASTLQASTIIARVAHESVRAIDHLFPRTLGAEAADDVARAARLAAAVSSWYPVMATKTGYVQRVDEAALLAAAGAAGRLVQMERGVGEFVIEGVPLALIAADAGPGGLRPDVAAAARIPAPDIASREDDDLETLAGRIARTFHVGRHRTIEQDAAFGVRQLVDVALKALSPGVNDTTTAVSCVDYLGALLVRVAHRRIESPVRECDGEVRVLARGASFEALLRLACDEIRQSGAGNVSVLRRQLDMLREVASCTEDAHRRSLLGEQVRLIHEVADRTVEAPFDRNLLETAYLGAVGSTAPTSSGDGEPPTVRIPPPSSQQR